MSCLYVVSTPIGNLEDITLRALRILKEVDFMLCEDTRVTKKLLQHYNINTPTISYHEHSELSKINYILELLKEGKNLALVSDAGTPGISDPGANLIRLAIQQCNNVTITAVPGPSAAIAAASISGFPMEKFVFMGFPPHKTKRRKFFEEVSKSKYPVILYESRYRIIKSLRELQEKNLDLEVVVCRELTKKFETVYRGNIEEVAKKIEDGNIKGEFVVIVS